MQSQYQSRNYEFRDRAIMLVGHGILKKLKKSLKRLHRNNEGATAVEYAIIGPIFFALLFAAVELGLILTKTSLLEMSASDISKTIYIGAAANGDVSKEDLEKEVCDLVGIVDPNCLDNLAIELTEVPSFLAIPQSDAKCIDKDEPINPTVSFDPGSADSIVYMRICLTTGIFTPGLGFGLALPKTDNGKIQIVSSLAFANEPF